MAVTIGHGAYTGVDPIGGGPGFTDIRSSGDYTASTIDQLRSIFNSYNVNGKVVYIPEGATIVLDNYPSQAIPAGVHIASNRGLWVTDHYSVGGRFYYSRMDTRYLYGVSLAGDGVLFSGLRFQGPDGAIGTNGGVPLTGGILSSGRQGLEVRNCELFNWPYGACLIYGDRGVNGSNNPGRAYVHHSNFHNNRRAGVGYGIEDGSSSSLVEACMFNYGRHAHAGTRTRTWSEWRYNLFGPEFTNAVWDHHGGNDDPTCYSYPAGPNISIPAGDTLWLHHNTFQDTDNPSVALRGIPYTMCTINNCWSLCAENRTWGYSCSGETKISVFCEKMCYLPGYGYDAPLQGAYVRMQAYNNWFGTSPPPGGGTPPIVASGAVTDVGETYATLNGTLSSKGDATVVYVMFEYGLTAAYGSTTPPQARTQTGTFSDQITGLSANTLYHYRAKATGDGEGYGVDLTFTTGTTPPPPPPPPPVPTSYSPRIFIMSRLKMRDEQHGASHTIRGSEG